MLCMRLVRKFMRNNPVQVHFPSDGKRASGNRAFGRLDAQTLHRRSCERYSEAVANHEIKKVEYMVLTGRLA